MSHKVDSNKIPITTKQLDDFFNTHQAFYGLPRERISILLLVQLYIHSAIKYYDIFQVTDEIKYLEGLAPATRTKKETQFKGDILKGLWKKHFFSARYIFKNINNYWASKKGDRELSEYLETAFKQNESEFLEQQTINKISHYFTFHAFEQKAQKSSKPSGGLTGEWIIFAKYEEKNYYLCIGHHNQDDKIMSNIRNICVDEFPFIF